MILLAAPHRSFFLAAALWALLAMLAWLVAWEGGLPLDVLWHGHEMIFGFAVAAIAGFVLTAAPNWTGSAPLRGRPLLALLLVWLAGRLAMPIPAIAWLDLAFLPLLAVAVGWMLIRAGNTRNYPVLAVLLLLTACNVDYHWGDPSRALWLATLLISALIALIGGRITPLFTQNALRQAVSPDITCRTPPWLDRLAVPAIMAAVVVELALPHSAWSGGMALAAAVVLGARMAGWQTWRTRRFPILCVLHLGYAWVPIGFALLGLALLTDAVAPTAALHALTAGAIGVMVLGVMSRAALGHSGRPLVTPRLTVIGYLLVNLGALLRVVWPSAGGMIAAALLWSAGYLLFIIDYWPILTRPRRDGRPG
jgi:uncharacterized protein involved in response to NO